MHARHDARLQHGKLFQQVRPVQRPGHVVHLVARRFGGGRTLTGDGVFGGDGMDRGGASRGRRNVAVQRASLSSATSGAQRGSGLERVVSTRSAAAFDSVARARS